jgi:hypothetical protein
MRKFIVMFSILGLSLLLGLLVAWDEGTELSPLGTLITCDPVFFPPAVDTFISDVIMNANIGKSIGGDCASKKSQYFTLKGATDWVPDLVGPRSFGTRIYVTSAGPNCSGFWVNTTVPSGQRAKDVAQTTGGCIFSSTGTFTGYVKYRTPSTSTSTGSSVMVTDVISYQ